MPVRGSDDVPRRIDAVSLRIAKTRRQERMQIHHAVGGAVPQKRMSRSIGSSSAPTDLPGGGHLNTAARRPYTGAVPKPTRVQIDSTRGAASPKQGVHPTGA